MTIEAIFIPTVKRVDNQITYDHLPSELKKKVVFVVQKWERPQYEYDCNYVVLPENLNLSDPLCMSKTREFIYREGKDIKYCILDDDLKFKRRNSKRFSGTSDMEKSRRDSSDEDNLEMFKLFDDWLDESNVSFCGPSQIQNIPGTKPFSSNTSVSSGVWFNGPDFRDVLEEIPKICRYGSDAFMFLGLLARGFGNRVSEIFCFDNISLTGKLEENVWSDTKFNDVWESHKIINSHYPDFFKILLDENGDRVKGGFRNFGKVRTSWSEAYKQSQKRETTSLESLFT